MLLELLFNTEYRWEPGAPWCIDHDDNRIVDGLELRSEFAFDRNYPPTLRDELGPCSFLEVLIGLSRRLAFNAGGRAPGWAWQLLHNLELHRMTDPLDRRKARKAEDILQAVIERRYRPDGGGGFFPLISAEEDQTQVELWYQMSAYISEIHPEYR